MSDHLSHLERSIRGLLPLDFPPELPVYVVSRWDCGADFRKPVTGLSAAFGWGDLTAAWTAPHLDLYLRPFLERIGTWRGRGFATLVNEEHFAGRPADLLPTILHEAAHFQQYLAGGWRSQGEGAAEYRAIRQWRLRIALEDALKRAELTAPPVPWDGHGPDFVRAALHIRHRSLAQGHDPGWLRTDGNLLADPLAYMLHLEDELDSRADEPLESVLADEPPQAFTEFARRDIESKEHLWRQHHEHRITAGCAAAAD